MLASLPVGANVYLMAREFGVLGGPVAASLLLSTRARGGDDARGPGPDAAAADRPGSCARLPPANARGNR